MLAEISSRIAACGQPPVSIARIRSAGRASLRMRNSWSSLVKMSLVTAANVWALNSISSRKPLWMWIERRRRSAMERPNLSMRYQAYQCYIFLGILDREPKATPSYQILPVFAKEDKSASQNPRHEYHRNAPANTNSEGSLCPIPSGVVRHIPFGKLT